MKKHYLLTIFTSCLFVIGVGGSNAFAKAGAEKVDPFVGKWIAKDPKDPVFSDLLLSIDSTGDSIFSVTMMGPNVSSYDRDEMPAVRDGALLKMQGIPKKISFYLIEKNKTLIMMMSKGNRSKKIKFYRASGKKDDSKNTEEPMLAVIETAGGTIVTETDAQTHALKTLVAGKTYYIPGTEGNGDKVLIKVVINNDSTHLTWERLIGEIISAGDTAFSIDGNVLVFGSEKKEFLGQETDFINILGHHDDGSTYNTRWYEDRAKAEAYLATL